MHKLLLKIGLLMFVVTAIATSPALFAHHAFSATFMEDKKVSVQGVVTKFSFRNPHVLIYFDVTNKDGSVTGWVSEGNSATLLRRSGWSAKTFVAGSMIRVSGDATHDGSPMTSIDFVEILDPKTLAVIETKVRDNRLELYKPVVEDSVPLELDDKRPNLNGVWTIQYRGIGPPPVPAVPLNDVGQAVQDALDLANDPQIFCDPPGLIRQAVTHHPLRFTLADDHVLMEYEEFAGRRKIYFDERAFKGIKTHLGDSIARYEGDKLIIETKNLLSDLSTTEGNRLSDEAIIIETYQRGDKEAGRTALKLNIVAKDSLYLAEDLVVDKVLWDGGNSYEMLENDCKSPLRQRSEVSPAMSFFITSEGLGDGANLGGLAGADVHCNAQAEMIGQGAKDWVAYLSTTGENGVDARDRIGKGPWYNAQGIVIAADIGTLHLENNLNSSTIIDQMAQPVALNGEKFWHDILTGSRLDGTAVEGDEDTTCGNWTSNGEGSAKIGHSDRVGGGDNPTSWVSAHPTKGCSQEQLQSTGGNGLFYCFAK